jgi:hypothetical protein
MLTGTLARLQKALEKEGIVFLEPDEKCRPGVRPLKRVTDADPTIVLPPTAAAPWLGTATAAFYVTDKLAVYAGYTNGLEESAVAPIEAVNRNEALPAIRTKQKDAGIRWTIPPDVSMVAGVFEQEASHSRSWRTSSAHSQALYPRSSPGR